MHQDTLRKVQGYQDRIASLNAVPADQVRRGQQFTVTPSQDQKLRTAIAQSSAFLNQVTMIGVDNQSGAAISLGVSGTIASRTKTSGAGAADRVATDPTGLTQDTYFAAQTNFDSALPYSTLDAWRHDPNFQRLWTSSVIDQMGRDLLIMGWNGTSTADTTDRSTSPLLQDVNTGWFQKMRVGNAGRWLARGPTHAGELRIGTVTGADYRNLDHLVTDLAQTLHPAYADDPSVTVAIGLGLLNDKYMTFFGDDSGDAPMEREAIERLLLNKRIGPYRAVVAPFMPDRALYLGPLKNLCIYSQNNTRRRTILDNAKRDQIEDFQSVNLAYVIARFEACAGCENIIYAGEGTWT